MDWHYSSRQHAAEVSRPQPQRSPVTLGLGVPLIKVEDDWCLVGPSSSSPLPQPHLKHAVPNTRTQKTATKRNHLPDSIPHRQVRAAIPQSLERSLHAKSNYQNIVDGTTLGTFYSDEFAAKVRSKRAAHRMSEKARRDRLTAAIRQLQEVLPDSIRRDTEGPDANASLLLSKATVVESAILYIGQLKANMATREDEWG